MTATAEHITSDDHRKGLIITTVGGVLFTFDIPLLRLAGGDSGQ